MQEQASQKPVEVEDVDTAESESLELRVTEKSQSVSEIVRPPKMTEEEDQQVKQTVSDILDRLAGAEEGVEALDFQTKISNFGLKAEQDSLRDLKGLLGQRMGDMIRRDKRLAMGPNQQIGKDLLRLRNTLREITPSEIEKGPIAKIPFIGDRLVRVMQRIMDKYDTVITVLEDIEKNLKNSKTRVLQDNAELKIGYEQFLERRKVIDYHIYCGQLLVKGLDELISQTTDLQRQAELREVLHDVLSRVDALARAKELLAQGRVELSMTINTNNKLVRSVDTAVDSGMAVTTVGVLLYSALQRQAEIIAVLEQHREFLEKQMVTVAEMVRDNQGKAYEFLRDPLARMAKIEEAHSILLEALKERDRFIQEGIESARVNIPKLAKMTQELDDRIGGVRVEEVSSLELQVLPSRPVGSTGRATI